MTQAYGQTDGANANLNSPFIQHHVAQLQVSVDNVLLETDRDRTDRQRHRKDKDRGERDRGRI